MKFISECSLSKTISQLQNRKLTPEKLINNLCDKLDKWDSKIKAFLPEPNRRERLHQDLDQLYQKFPNPDERPVLFGIPIGVKDIFHTNGFATRAGSDLPPEALKGNEAEVVSILKDAGALIMGKTVTTEFAYFYPGPTGNPHDLNNTPGIKQWFCSSCCCRILPVGFGNSDNRFNLTPCLFLRNYRIQTKLWQNLIRWSDSILTIC
jgi:Asp-tRNA(Asn)/Glu-tRNA(Gln) amidotransferase A subunit family amidase